MYIYIYACDMCVCVCSTQLLVVVVDLRDVNDRGVGPKESPVGERANDQRLRLEIKEVGDKVC